MRKFINIGMILMVAAAILTGCGSKDETPDRHGEMLQEVRSVDKLQLASMSVTKTAVTERSDWYKVGKRIAAYSYDTYLQAYIDLSEMQAEDMVFDDEAHTVSVTLPAVQTEIVGRDMELRKEYENVGILRSDIDARERAEMKERANTSLKEEVELNPEFREHLRLSGERKARAFFEEFFATNGYTADIKFRASLLRNVKM